MPSMTATPISPAVAGNIADANINATAATAAIDPTIPVVFDLFMLWADIGF